MRGTEVAAGRRPTPAVTVRGDGANLAGVALAQVLGLFALFELPAALLGVSAAGVGRWIEVTLLTLGVLLVTGASVLLHRGSGTWWVVALAGAGAAGAGLAWPWLAEASSSGVQFHLVGTEDLGLFGEVSWAAVWATLKLLLATCLTLAGAVLLTRSARSGALPAQTLARTAGRCLSFDGRSGVGEYVWFSVPSTVLGLALLASVTVGVQSALLDPTAPTARFVSLAVPVLWHGLLHLAVGLPVIALTVRRLQDRGHGLPFLLVLLVPVIGGLILLVACLLPGTRGPNRFGPPPSTVLDLPTTPGPDRVRRT